MLDVSKWSLQSRLAAAASISDTTLRVSPSEAQLFAVAEGLYYYLTLRDGPLTEVVLVKSTLGGTLNVDRGQDNTVARAWRSGSCLTFEWNPAQLRDFIAMQRDGEPVYIKPGKYCLDCNTCLTLNAAGRITEVDGSSPC